MRLPRLMITAPKSGSGKTIITCGLLELFKGKGIDIASYKCGPDYIDPMFHRSVIGVPGRNLDAFFSPDDEIRTILASEECEAAVLEGVMGIYDGISGCGSKGSCYDVAAASGTPVILVMDVKGMGNTMLSLIRGILMDDTRELIRGIVLNRISGHYYSVIEPELTEMLEVISSFRKSGVRLIGGIPDSKDIKLGSRHLGLMLPGEVEDLRDQIRTSAKLIEDNIDMDALSGIMDSAFELPDRPAQVEAAPDGPVLAVARDEAFCFYYEENLRLLKSLGIRIREFSPLRDEAIPEDADGLLLGGGYPELYAEQLSNNSGMRQSVHDAVISGMPCLAECGGFMYLMDEIVTDDGTRYPMASVISGSSSNTGRLGRFGYVTVTGKDDTDSLISGLSIRGHEFHYYDSTNNGSDATAVKPGSGRSWECIHATDTCVCGYPHLYYPSCPELAVRFRTAME